MPLPISGKTRDEVQHDAMKVAPKRGMTGERPEVPTPPTTVTGMPTQCGRRAAAAGAAQK